MYNLCDFHSGLQKNWQGLAKLQFFERMGEYLNYENRSIQCFIFNK